MLVQFAILAAGVTILAFGADFFVKGASSLAQRFGISQFVIGLIIVGFGTSTPELAVNLKAALSGSTDIAIGNVVGSNIFNLLGILGIAAIFTPGGLVVAPSVINFDLPVMVAVALACLPIFFTGMSIARWEGALFLAYYVAYTTYLVLAATQHDALPAFSSAMLTAVLPLTAVTLAVLGTRAFLESRGPSGGARATD